MLILTMFALFMDDFRLWLFPKDADGAFAAFTWIILILFIIEFIANCLCVPGYMHMKKFPPCSMFFWLDLLSIFSILSILTFGH